LYGLYRSYCARRLESEWRAMNKDVKAAQVVSMAEVKKRKMIAQYVAFYWTAYANQAKQ